jgi:hypothetical protein
MHITGKEKTSEARAVQEVLTLGWAVPECDLGVVGTGILVR